MSPRKSHKRRPRKSGNKKIILIIGFLAVVSAIVVLGIMGAKNSSNENDSSAMKVLLKTSMGDIMIELRSDMPITTGNFRNLVEQGVYDGTIFHRVIDGFMVQGGDPTGTGYGDPSIPTILDEFTDNNRNDKGTIAMANKGIPNTGSSQFFINLVNNNYLDSRHPVFGKVVEGMGVVEQIGKVATDANDRPLQEVRIISAQLLD